MLPKAQRCRAVQCLLHAHSPAARTAHAHRSTCCTARRAPRLSRGMDPSTFCLINVTAALCLPAPRRAQPSCNWDPSFDLRNALRPPQWCTHTAQRQNVLTHLSHCSRRTGWCRVHGMHHSYLMQTGARCRPNTSQCAHSTPLWVTRRNATNPQ